MALAVWALWTRMISLSDKLYELGTAQIRAAAEARKALEAVDRDVQDITREFSRHDVTR